MENNIAARLKEFMDSTGMNNSQFADTCGIPKPSLSQILSGRNKKISNQLLELLHAAFPELNVMWLVFGEGPMKLGTPGDPAVSNFEQPDFEPQVSCVRSEDTPYYGNRGDEVSFLPSDLPASDFQATHGGLTTFANTGNQTDLQRDNTHLKISELQLQIEKLQAQISEIRKNPRKVASITVYYDDSTFETFKPDN